MKKGPHWGSFWDLADMRGFYLDQIRSWPIWAKLALCAAALAGCLICCSCD